MKIEVRMQLLKRWFVVIMLAGVVGAESSVNGQDAEVLEVLNVNQQISIRAEDVTLSRLLERWDQATGMRSSVPADLADWKLSIRISGVSANDALRSIFDGQPFGYFLLGGQLVVTAISAGNSSAQNALPPQSRVIPSPFGPVATPPGYSQPFIQLPVVLGALPAPPFFAPPLRTTPPAGAANGPLENKLFGPIQIYRGPREQQQQ